MKQQKFGVIRVLLIIALGLIALPSAVSAQDAPIAGETGIIIAEGLNSPQGILVDDDGAVLVIDSGVGGDEETPFFSTQAMEDVTAGFGTSARIIRITEAGQEEVAALPSLLMGQETVGGGRLAILDGTLYATVGQGAGDPESEGIADFGGVVMIEEGEISAFFSTWDFERAENPDGTDLHDSHPYGITAGPDGYLYVADSGANDLLQIDPESGEIVLVAVLDPLPGVFPSATRGGEMLTDPVPTAVVFDEEGNAYVAYLSGAPFLPGSSGVKMVTPDGEVSDAFTGLTMLTDLRVGPDGEIYGVQFGMFTESGPVPNAGSVVHLYDDGTFDVVVDGLSFPSSLDFNAEGDLFVSINGLGAPGSGAVVMFPAVAMGAEMADEAMADHAACAGLPSYAELTAALVDVVAGADNGGFGFHMWATVVNRDGEVCNVTFSGADRGDQFPGSRVISAQKANTANAFSLPGLALSTGNLFTAVQPGNSLFGLQESNPVDTAVAYGGDAEDFGQETDPMVGHRIGGVNVFGGGLALYAADGTVVGAVGVSGDSSCTDHIIAWKIRDALELDYVPGGISETGDDNLVYDQESGWAHPECGLGEVPITTALLDSHPLGE